MKYEECKKIVARIRFEKAIAVDDSSKSVANQIDFSSMSMLQSVTNSVRDVSSFSN